MTVASSNSTASFYRKSVGFREFEYRLTKSLTPIHGEVKGKKRAYDLSVFAYKKMKIQQDLGRKISLAQLASMITVQENATWQPNIVGFSGDLGLCQINHHGKSRAEAYRLVWDVEHNLDVAIILLGEKYETAKWLLKNNKYTYGIKNTQKLSTMLYNGYHKTGAKYADHVWTQKNYGYLALTNGKGEWS